MGTHQNYLLSRMWQVDLQALKPSLQYVELKRGAQLEHANKPIEYLYFPESGLLSIIALSGKRRVEVGLIGREGVSGSAVILGNDRSPHACVVQVAGNAYRIGADELSALMKRSLSLNELMTLYVNNFLIQSTYTTLANAQGDIEQRLARWLLMSQDRVGKSVQLTHEHLAGVLGVRRAGITETLNSFERKMLVHTSRGHILIADRSGLKRVAGKFYGVPEVEYSRMQNQREAAE